MPKYHPVIFATLLLCSLPLLAAHQFSHDYTYNDPLDYTHWFDRPLKAKNMTQHGYLGHSNLVALEFIDPAIQPIFDRSKLIPLTIISQTKESLDPSHSKDEAPSSTTQQKPKETTPAKPKSLTVSTTPPPPTQPIQAATLANPALTQIDPQDILLLFKHSTPSPTPHTTQEVVVPFEVPRIQTQTRQSNATFIQE